VYPRNVGNTTYTHTVPRPKSIINNEPSWKPRIIKFIRVSCPTNLFFSVLFVQPNIRNLWIITWDGCESNSTTSEFAQTDERNQERNITRPVSWSWFEQEFSHLLSRNTDHCTVIFHKLTYLLRCCVIVWHTCPMQELLSHRKLETRRQQQNYKCLQLVVRQQRANELT
jgi:hypothetical protein